jgi:tetratricopeptide (TPR) repeat protein
MRQIASAPDRTDGLRSRRSSRCIATSLDELGFVAYDQGDYERAMALYEEVLALLWELRDKRGIAASLGSLGSRRLSKAPTGGRGCCMRKRAGAASEAGG